jgi:hypothetical protein
MRLNMTRFLLKTNKATNMMIEPQDVIFVPRNFVKNVGYFVTELIGPLSQGAQQVYMTSQLREKRW